MMTSWWCISVKLVGRPLSMFRQLVILDSHRGQHCRKGKTQLWHSVIQKQSLQKKTGLLSTYAKLYILFCESMKNFYLLNGRRYCWCVSSIFPFETIIFFFKSAIHERIGVSSIGAEGHVSSQILQKASSSALFCQK